MAYDRHQLVASIDNLATKLNTRYSGRDAFPYGPLNSTKSEIRVVKFQRLSTALSGTFHFKLQTISLLDPKRPNYCAFSYTWNGPFEGLPSNWDDESATIPIVIDGRLQKIRYNLFTLLSQFFGEHDPVDKGLWYWIDAICINQSDDLEKGQQIQLMPQIYRNSGTTYIWLGHETPDGTDVARIISDAMALRTLYPRLATLEHTESDTADTEREISDALQSLFTYSSCQSLAAFFRRSWFRRVWIIQEAVLSPSKVIVLGPYYFDFEQLYWTMEIAMRSAYFFRNSGSDTAIDIVNSVLKAAWAFMAIDQLINLPDVQSGSAITKSASLPDLLWRLRFFNCSVAKDKIFAAKGLTTDHACITTDYAASLVDVVTSTTKSWIEQKSNLRILGYLTPSTLSHDGLPSWAVDWTMPLQNTHPRNPLFTKPSRYSLLYTSSEDTIEDMLYSAGDQEVGLTVRFEHNGREMVLGGVQFLDDLEYVSTEQACEALDDVESNNGITDHEIGIRITKRLQRIAKEWLSKTKAHRPHLSLEPDDYIDTTLLGLPKMAKYCGADGLSTSLNEAFARTMYTDTYYDSDQLVHMVHTTDSKLSRIPQDDRNPFRDPSFFLSEASLLSNMSWTMVLMCFERHLASSKTYGRIGLVPQEALPGDRICVVAGHYAPLLLRRKSPVNDEYYTMVGECYIHGLMDGLGNADAELRASPVCEIRVV
jgi:hypothetical protein